MYKSQVFKVCCFKIKAIIQRSFKPLLNVPTVPSKFYPHPTLGQTPFKKYVFK